MSRSDPGATSTFPPLPASVQDTDQKYLFRRKACPVTWREPIQMAHGLRAPIIEVNRTSIGSSELLVKGLSERKVGGSHGLRCGVCDMDNRIK